MLQISIIVETGLKPVSITILDAVTDNDRQTWDDYFLETADSVSKRATCDRGKSGCIIVKNRQIQVTGFIGSPAGFEHCDDTDHQMKRLHTLNIMNCKNINDLLQVTA